MPLHALDDHRRGEHYYDELQADAVAVAGRDARAAGARSSAGSSATRTATSPTTARGCDELGLDARRHPDARRSRTSCRSCPRPTSASTSTSTSCRRTTTSAGSCAITTSGSTGEPFVCFADRRQLEIRWAATLRAHGVDRLPLRRPPARLWHQTIGMTKSQVARERARRLAHRAASSSRPSRCATTRMRRVRRADRGAASRCCSTATPRRSTSSRSTSRQHGGLEHATRAASCRSAQTLPDAEPRGSSRRPSAASVFDKYGSREFSGIAYECEAHAGHHVVGRGLHRRDPEGRRPARARARSARW